MAKKKSPWQKHDEEDWDSHSLDPTPTDYPKHKPYFGPVLEVSKEDGTQHPWTCKYCGKVHKYGQFCDNPDCSQNAPPKDEVTSDITLYGAAFCKPCQQLKNLLTKHGIPFKYVDLVKHPELDITVMPRLVVDGVEYTGYGPEVAEVVQGLVKRRR